MVALELSRIEKEKIVVLGVAGALKKVCFAVSGPLEASNKRSRYPVERQENAPANTLETKNTSKTPEGRSASCFFLIF